MSKDPIELEPDPDPSAEFTPRPDPRARMEEPLPVKLVAVDDVVLATPAGVDEALDAFYAGLLDFEKLGPETLEPQPAYRAENFILRFEIEGGPFVERDDFRVLGIEVQSLAETEHKLVQAELEYQRQRSVTPGRESIVLRDPAGNWIELVEMRGVA